MSNFDYACDSDHAPKLAAWLRERGGICVWTSADLSSGGQKMVTPALDSEGRAAHPPHWSVDKTPTKITDAARVGVRVLREVKRVRVAVEKGQGLSFDLTEASSRRLREELEKAGPESGYAFDYDRQEAVISVCEREVALAEWEAQHGSS